MTLSTIRLDETRRDDRVDIEHTQQSRSQSVSHGVQCCNHHHCPFPPLPCPPHTFPLSLPSFPFPHPYFCLLPYLPFLPSFLCFSPHLLSSNSSFHSLPSPFMLSFPFPSRDGVGVSMALQRLGVADGTASIRPSACLSVHELHTVSQRVQCRSQSPTHRTRVAATNQTLNRRVLPVISQSRWARHCIQCLFYLP